VLVVEDNADVAGMFVILLQSMGHSVQLAVDGASALDVARQFQPDVAFIDIGMPDMDGYEVAKRLRQQINGAVLVALTGYSRREDIEAAKRAGFDRHLVKPARIDDLIEVLDGNGGRADPR
jgi:CheY-like chemotaxis protein